VLAVDLGSRTTKAVHLTRRGESVSLANYALLDAPVYEKGMTPEILAEHLKNVSRAVGNTRTKQVTLSIGVNDTLFRQVEVPLMPVGDVRQMLKFNSKNYLQQDLPDYVFDCWYVTSNLNKPAQDAKTPSGTQKHKAIVGGAKKKMLDELQAAIKLAGLVADQVVPGLAGPGNAFEAAEPEIFGKEVVALVDIGFKNSTITILNCGEMMLNRVVAIGGDRLTGGLAETMGISYTEAENIKVGMASEVQANLEPLINPLGRELRASIDFFEHQHDKTASHVFVSGGSARSEIILQALQTELMVPCKSWNPARSLQLALPPEKMGEVEQVAPQLAVAIGAAVSTF
jgi:type IV pilus assembly protein PilM